MGDVISVEEIVRILFVIQKCGREGSEDMLYWENQLKERVGS
jgi:hypothetical protein